MRWPLVLVLLLLVGAALFADPLDLIREGDNEELSPASQRLLDKLAEQGSWDLVAVGVVGAEWYLYKRPGSIGQAGRPAAPEKGLEALAEKAGTKGLIGAAYDYIEVESGMVPPSSFEAATAAKMIKTQYQRSIIINDLTYHQNEFPPQERAFWDWYQSEFLPGYHDIYGDPGSGTSHGDPHVTTLDGLHIDLQSVGEFILVRSKIDGFEIQARHQPFASSQSVSLNYAVALSFDGLRLVVDAYDSVPLHYNGQPVNPDSDSLDPKNGISLYRSGGSTYVFFPGAGALIELSYWSRGAISIDVGLPSVYQGNVEGLLGDYDGDPSNDLRLRDGVTLPPEDARQSDVAGDSLYAEFAESWRIRPEESLFDYSEGKTTEDYTDRSFPSEGVDLGDYSAEEHAEADEACKAAGVDEDSLLEDCVYDLLVTGDRRFALGAASVGGGRPLWEDLDYFYRLDLCLRLPCSRGDDPVCESLGVNAPICEVRWPEHSTQEHLCVRSPDRCERDDQCCGYMSCNSGRCTPRTEGERCAATRNCAGGLLCSFDEHRRCE
ncbi:MAG: VWD domain-containing protein [Wenzhouxiangellaceae bacterium]